MKIYRGNKRYKAVFDAINYWMEDDKVFMDGRLLENVAVGEELFFVEGINIRYIIDNEIENEFL